MGVIATALIDLWAKVLRRGFRLPTTNWSMVGRWLGHLPQGKFIHRPISSSHEVPHERYLGWALHYLIGIVHAVI
ncbi:MAG: DUF2938 family protein [Rhodocyclaceae bacterium]|nr:DUF2938 family protein [Rhodocyclaceae bacterium]